LLVHIIIHAHWCIVWVDHWGTLWRISRDPSHGAASGY